MVVLRVEIPASFSRMSAFQLSAYDLIKPSVPYAGPSSTQLLTNVFPVAAALWGKEPIREVTAINTNNDPL